MTPTDDLFVLIQAMSKAERRRFALEAREDHNYVRLFQAIAAQGQYDEAALREAFAGEAFVKNFSVAKAYLYDRILHVLRSPLKPTSPEMAMRRLLDDVELLQGKGLFAQAQKVVLRGIAQARALDLPALEAEFHKWRRRVVNQLGGKARAEALEAVDAEETAALQALVEDSQLRALFAQVQGMALQQIDLRQPANANRLSDLMAHPLLAGPPDGLRFQARCNYHLTHATHTRMHGDAAASLAHHQAHVQVWEAHPRQVAAFPHPYVNALAGFLDSCIRSHAYEGFAARLAALRALPLQDAKLRAQAFYLGHHLALRYAISTGHLDEGVQQAADIEAGLVTHARFLHPGVPLTFRYNLAVVHFLAGDHRTTVRYVNRILNDTALGLRKDVLDATRLLELAAHFELAHHDLLESLLRSMDRRLRLQPRAYAFEKVLVQGIRRLLDTPEEGQAAVFVEMREAFDTIKGATYIAGREEIHWWLLGRIEGRPVQALMQAADQPG